MLNTILKKGIFFLIISYVLPLSAQVTVGVDEAPSPGALLQLKSHAGVENGDVNATRGLGLPRVHLTNIMPLTKEDLAKSIGNMDGSYDLDEHIGLFVYNVTQSTPKQCALIPEGPYVWNGRRWDRAQPYPDVKIYIDTRPQVLGEQQYHYRKFGKAGDWMVENLRYLPTDGSITVSTNADTNETKCYGYPAGFYGYGPVPSVPHESWSPPQGLLYSYPAVTLDKYKGVNVDNGNNPDEPKIQGLCPPGWHVPTDYEWSQLEEELSKNPQIYSTITEPTPWRDRGPGSASDGNDDDYEQQYNRGEHGEVMKSSCPMPNVVGFPADQVAQGFPMFYGGFAALLTGGAAIGEVALYGESAVFWTSSSLDDSSALNRAAFAFDKRVGRQRVGRAPLYSVRCKR